MPRLRTAVPLSLAALALAVLTGCAGGDAASEPAEAPDTAAASDGNNGDGSNTEAGEGDGGEAGAAPTLDGEGIAYGAESITGIDLDVSCMGSGDELAITGTGTGPDGELHSVTYTTGVFSYTMLSEDMTSEATSILGGADMPDTEVTVEPGEGAYAFAGTGMFTDVSGFVDYVEFVSNVTCDTTL